MGYPVTTSNYIFYKFINQLNLGDFYKKYSITNKSKILFKLRHLLLIKYFIFKLFAHHQDKIKYQKWSHFIKGCNQISSKINNRIYN